MEKTAVKRKTHTSYIVKKRYEEKTYDRVTALVKKGQKEIMKAHAVARGESLNGFVNRAIDETMTRDSKNPINKQQQAFMEFISTMDNTPPLPDKFDEIISERVNIDRGIDL